MPLHRRLPKRGFTILDEHLYAQVRLSELQKVPVDQIDIQVLKQAGIIGHAIKFVKVFKSGELSRKVTLQGMSVTAGAKAAIEAAGGSIA